jgi:hypothetical protein
MGGRAVAADSGAFTLAGQAANLLVAYVLTADSGAFTLTGQDATLTYTPVGSYSLTAESGTFVLTGQAVTLTYSGEDTGGTGPTDFYVEIVDTGAWVSAVLVG